ncbi:MAG: WG repeat-containing protein [Cyanobacteria bacterium HKST-UBA02]|nr:WG repeat-containing protein [Cyanobacteria bacterium HKST-UBA02]
MIEKGGLERILPALAIRLLPAVLGILASPAFPLRCPAAPEVATTTPVSPKDQGVLDFQHLSNDYANQTSALRQQSPDGKMTANIERASIPHLNKLRDKLIILNTSDKRETFRTYSDFPTIDNSEAETKKTAERITRTSIHDFSWSPDSAQIVWASSNGLNKAKLIGSTKFKVNCILKGTARACRWSPDGRYIASINLENETRDRPGQLHVIDSLTCKDIFRMEILGHSDQPIAWSPDSRWLAVRTDQEYIDILDAKKSWQVSSRIFSGFGRFVWSPDSTRIALSKTAGSIEIYSREGTYLTKYSCSDNSDLVWLKGAERIVARTKTVQSISLDEKAKQPAKAKSARTSAKLKGRSGKPIDTALPRFGLVDTVGKTIIPLQYQSIDRLSDGTLAASSFDEKNPLLIPASVELFNSSGKRINTKVPDGYLTVKPVKDYLVIRRDTEISPEYVGYYRYGLCDRTGRCMLPAIFREIRLAFDHYVLVKEENYKSAVYDTTGNYLGEMESDPWSDFRSIDDVTLARMFPGEFTYVVGGDTALISKTNAEGKQQFQILRGFSEGLGIDPMRRSFINTSGEIQFQTEVVRATPFKNGLSAVLAASNKSGAINKSGDFVFEANDIRRAGDSLFAGHLPADGKAAPMRLLDASGKVLASFPPDTNDVGEEGEGLIPFCQGGEYYPKYQFCQGGRWGYMDLNGKIVIPPRYEKAGRFINGYAVVTASHKRERPAVGLIDRSGKMVLNPIYDSLEIVPKGKIIASIRPARNFSPVDWQSEPRGEKMERFFGLLEDYDLIGMDKAKLLALLGKPERNQTKATDTSYVAYTVRRTGCMNQRVEVIFEIGKGKVNRWRWWSTLTADAPWIDENVLYVKRSGPVPSYDEMERRINPTGRRQVSKN